MSPQRKLRSARVGRGQSVGVSGCPHRPQCSLGRPGEVRGFQTLESWRLTAFGNALTAVSLGGHRVVNLRCVCVCVFIGGPESTPGPAGCRHSLSSAGVRRHSPQHPRRASRGAESREARRRQRPPAGSCLGFWVQTLRARRELTPSEGEGRSSRQLQSPSLLKCGPTVLDSATPT